MKTHFQPLNTTSTNEECVYKSYSSFIVLMSVVMHDNTGSCLVEFDIDMVLVFLNFRKNPCGRSRVIKTNLMLATNPSVVHKVVVKCRFTFEKKETALIRIRSTQVFYAKVRTNCKY